MIILNEGKLNLIKNLFAKEDIALAYLHGSYALNRETALSDLDIAVYFPFRSAYENLKRELHLESKIAKILKFENVEVKNLANSPILFKYKVVSKGKCIYCADESFRVKFEEQVIIEYLDFKFVLDEQNYYLFRRIEEGTYGYRP